MKSLKNISLFKLFLFTLVSIRINNIFLYIFVSLYFLFNDCKYLILYICLILSLTYMSSIKSDFVSIGIIDDRKSEYYIVDKFFYKCKLFTDDKLQIGDVLFFDCKFAENKNTDETKKNINYYGYTYCKIFNFKPRLLIKNYISSFSQSSVTVLKKFLYNINNHDDLSFNVGYGLAIYYLFRYIEKKNDNLCVILMIIYSLLFVFQIKLYLLIIDIILNRTRIDKLDKYAIELLTIYIINPRLFMNYSILVPLSIHLYSIVELNVNFKMFLSIIESSLFGEINIISMLFYKYYVIFQLLVLLSCFVLLIIPSFEHIFLFIAEIFSYLNDVNISIRGSLSIIGVGVLSYIIKIFKIDSQSFKLILMLLFLTSPLNNPFMHVSFIDVGQGDSILIKYPLNTCNILIDTGSAYNYHKLKKYLFKQGIYEIDYLIITHNDSDHNGNLASLENDFYVKEVIEEGKDIIVKKSKLKYCYLGEFDNDNDNSLVYMMDINGYKILFTGDISKNVEKLFINKYSPIDIDILKVSHHGSYTATSKYFLANTLPEYAVISTSGQYGHPAKAVINNLHDLLVNYYITKDAGDIEFYFTGLINFLKTATFNFVIMK